MSSFISLLYSATGADKLPLAIRRIIAVVILVSFIVFLTFKSSEFLIYFRDRFERTMEIQEVTLSELRSIKTDLDELERTTATKGDMKLIEVKIDKLEKKQSTTGEQFKYFIDHYENDSSDEIKQELDRIKNLLMNQRIEPKTFDEILKQPLNLTSYENKRFHQKIIREIKEQPSR